MGILSSIFGKKETSNVGSRCTCCGRRGINGHEAMMLGDTTSLRVTQCSGCGTTYCENCAARGTYGACCPKCYTPISRYRL